MFTWLGFRMFKWAGGPRKTFPEVVVVSMSTITNTHTSSNSTKGEGGGRGKREIDSDEAKTGSKRTKEQA